MVEETSIVGRPWGKRQLVTSKRKRFAGKRERLFLDHLAATCNVTRSAEAAGVSVQCAYRRRMKDEAFRSAWSDAIEQGYARLEAVLLERAGAAEPISVDGGLEVAPEPDIETAKFLLREHKRGMTGEARGGAAERKSAEWGEVERYFVAKLKMLKARIDEDTAATAGASDEAEPS
jgi:hypothetical protein